MAARYQSTKETTNFARICRVVVDVIPELFRELLTAQLSSHGLTNDLSNHKAKIFSLLNQEQKKILYPSTGQFQGSVKDFDLSLLYLLLRNLGNIPDHQNGWGQVPDAADCSLAANIDRLRLQRNKAYGHTKTASLSDGDFQTRWDVIRQSVEDIEKNHLRSGLFVAELNNILTMTMDPATEERYVKDLGNIEDTIADLRDNITAVTDNVTAVKSDVTAVKDDVTGMKDKVGAVRDDVTAVKNDVSSVRDEVTAVKDDVTGMKDKVGVVRDDVTAVKNDVTTVQDNVDAMRGEVGVLKDDVTAVGGKVSAVSDDVTVVKNAVTAVQDDVSAVRGKVGALKYDVSAVRGEVTAVRDDVDAVKEDVTAVRDDVKTAKDLFFSSNGEIHADLRPLIVKTKERITTDKKKKKFLETKGFRDAQEKLKKNRVIMIKGNTGDGKTSIAIQLMDWLIKEQQCRQPLQLHEIKKLEKMSPNLRLVTLIDDIFGEKDVERNDVREWNKRITDIETLFADEQTYPNFLIVTIRNEIYNVLAKWSLEPVFTKHNTIDLSSDTYRILEERKNLLKMYTPNNYEWEEKETEDILKCASSIGFPQCCNIFYNSEELQKSRGKFFEKPFKVLIEALSRLPQCSAILFLFFNGGNVKVNDLDPNSDKINKTLLEESFDINLIDGEDDRTALTYKQKVGFVKESLDRLLGFLVVKEEYWSGDEVYRFNHDSVHTTVALLYGNKTPIGYIQNCPVKSLGYLTLAETSSDMIVISPDHYTYLRERLVREFECEKYLHDIKSLDVWKDPEFVVSFVELLNERKVDKLAVLNRACLHGLKECGLYLLSEGVKPDEYTNWWSLITGGDEYSVFGRGEGDVDVLKKVFKYLNDKKKLDLLNEACRSGSKECGLHLLSEGVKPDKDTNWWSLITGGDVSSCGKGDEDVLKKVFKHLNDRKKLELLKLACRSGSKECVLYLLSDGVEPDNYTKWWSLITGGDGYSKGDVDVLKKVFKYLNNYKKRVLFNEACRYGSKECILYLLSEGVKSDKHTKWWSLITGGSQYSKGDVEALKKVFKYLNGKEKLDLLNKACHSGSKECVLYLLSEGVKPDNKTLLFVVSERSVELLCKLLLYDATVSWRDENNHNILHVVCRWEREEMVTELCDKCPDLVHDTNNHLRTPLHVAARKGNLSIFQTVERTTLKTLDKQCGTDKHVVHRDCEWGQYMSKLVDNVGRTVLHISCRWGNQEICVYLCEKYPLLIKAVDGKGQTPLHVSCMNGKREICVHLCEKFPSLTAAVDNRGRHCLHYIAESYRQDVDKFTECETHVKQYIESTGCKYDITTILDREGKSVLDMVKETEKRLEKEREMGRWWLAYDNRLYDHLIKVFGK
ncbi:uncharacterized protein LOC132554443 [Ylistrum balloti]|uniref:uncharacterized protein LOC132554443 n=1 Tax=Ylistrum balloti TaxID=509963 RepID=UPI002905A8B1|nr:uncharacterized protein LOC132554443 [Ylistrum balloti]